MPKHRLRHRCTLYAFFLLCAAVSPAQNPALERVGAAEGLSQGMIYDLLQDRQGFLWFATKDGLNRYDGYGFQVYQNNPFNPFSLSDNEVQCLLQDQLGRIWAGTANNGINLLDPQTGKFYHLDKQAGQNIQGLAQTTDGTVWVNSNLGIYRVLAPDSLPPNEPGLESVVKTQHFSLEELGGQTYPPFYTIDLKAARDGKLWISTIRQIGYIDPLSLSYQKVWTNPPLSGTDEIPTYFQEAPDGAMWVGQPGQLLRIRKGVIDRFKLPETSIFPYPNLVFDASGNLFASTRKQIYRLTIRQQQNPATARFELFHRFPTDGIIGSTRLLIDRSGLLWIGTNGYGLRKYNPGNASFHHYLAGKSPRRIVADQQQRVWVWFAGGAFKQLPEPEDQEQRLLLPDANLLQHDCVAAKDGKLWVLAELKPGDENKGVLIRLDGLSLNEELRIALPLDVSMFSRLYEDRKGMFWILGNQSIICSYNPQNAAFATYDFSEVTGFRELALCMQQDPAGLVWIGTPHGLVRGVANGEKMDFSLYKNNPKDPKSMSCNSILALLDDPLEPERYIWLGTKGGGLNRLDKSSGALEHYTDAEGLPNNVVYAILPDAEHALWLSTNCGLSKFNPQTHFFQNFFSVDGLQDNEFNTISYAADTQGRLYFGGVNGITAFSPAELKASFIAPRVLITGLRINNQPAGIGEGVLEKCIEQTKSITLKHGQNQLTFEFAAMDFSAPRMNQYRWRLKGVDQDWVESTIANAATYAHLAPGDYTFEVISGGSRGIWSGEPASLTIRILPAWWRTKWAYSSYFLLFVLAAGTFYHFQVNKIRLENKLAFEHREALRLADLDRLKTNFFSSVTHEFRTPLTLLMEPARQLLRELREPTQKYRMELIENSAKRLLQFVNQLLDLSKLEAGQMPLDLRPGNPAYSVRTVVEQFQVLAQQRSIRLELETSGKDSAVFFDALKWEQILTNLLSNAIKFSAPGGRISVKLNTHSTPTEIQYVLEVSDNGIGISAENLQSVFERFYQVPAPSAMQHEAAAGTGIGLSLTKELVERMGGVISVQSPGSFERGSSFTVRMSFKPAPVAIAVAEMPEQENKVKISGGVPAKTAPVPKPETAGAPLLLLIEDDAELRQFLRSCLPPAYRIAEAANGVEGIQMALELVPDLVISDLVMPHKNGFEVAETLKQDAGTSHIPVILLTAKSEVESKMQGLNRGADAYLTKPFRADELITQIENLLSSRKRLQEHFSRTTQKANPVEQAASAMPSGENEFLLRLIEVVETNLDNESMDADAFAKAVFISRSQLHRKINALTGLSLTEFVRNYRLDRAREMLIQRKGSISEIAWRTGFPNAKYFSTCFKERFGTTPSGAIAGA